MKLYYESSITLSHHGIKGQKWGVRRFQNKDGTLTAKGKKRYSDSSEDIKSMSDDELRAKINRLRNENRYNELTKKESKVSRYSKDIKKQADTGSNALKLKKNLEGSKDGYKLTGEGLKAVSKSANVAGKVSNIITDYKHGKKTNKKVKTMSDAELNEIVQRLDLEKQYSDVRKQARKRGKVNVREVLDIAGDILAITASATTIAVGVKKLLDIGGIDGFEDLM